jgi:hypothetical protein
MEGIGDNGGHGATSWGGALYKIRNMGTGLREYRICRSFPAGSG